MHGTLMADTHFFSLLFPSHDTIYYDYYEHYYRRVHSPCYELTAVSREKEEIWRKPKKGNKVHYAFRLACWHVDHCDEGRTILYQNPFTYNCQNKEKVIIIIITRSCSLCLLWKPEWRILSTKTWHELNSHMKPSSHLYDPRALQSFYGICGFSFCFFKHTHSTSLISIISTTLTPTRCTSSFLAFYVARDGYTTQEKNGTRSTEECISLLDRRYDFALHDTSFFSPASNNGIPRELVYIAQCVSE